MVLSKSLPGLTFIKNMSQPSLSKENLRELLAYLTERDNSRIIDGYNGNVEWCAKAASRSPGRNRYSNVFPWDRNRVRLPSSYSDYINASRILVNDSEYIALQGPLANTIHHFWAMCFHESEVQRNDVVIVVMVTPFKEDGRAKCEKYWPDLHQSWDLTPGLVQDGIELPDLSVETVEQNHISDGHFTLRHIQLKSGGCTKQVYHYHYEKWADTKAPPNVEDLMKLAAEVHHVKNSVENPPVPVIHCSAGVGRTGTFIAIDQLMYHDGQPLDVVQQMRNGRMMMVQTVYQLEFIYKAQRYIDKRPEYKE